MTIDSKLSDEQFQTAQLKASQFLDEVKACAITSSIATQQGNGKQDFFSALFAIAAQRIETDAQAFCDRAETIFDEIDAYGQEPHLDEDWLAQVTGEKDTFYFSTDSLVSEPTPLPRKQQQRQEIPDEKAVVNAVEQAIDQAEQNVIAIAHAENTQQWITAIHSALACSRHASFQQLLATTRLRPIELWLGLLLGHESWSMQQDSFYGRVSVRLKD